MLLLLLLMLFLLSIRTTGTAREREGANPPAFSHPARGARAFALCFELKKALTAMAAERAARTRSPQGDCVLPFGQSEPVCPLQGSPAHGVGHQEEPTKAAVGRTCGNSFPSTTVGSETLAVPVWDHLEGTEAALLEGAGIEDARDLACLSISSLTTILGKAPRMW